MLQPFDECRSPSTDLWEDRFRLISLREIMEQIQGDHLLLLGTLSGFSLAYVDEDQRRQIGPELRRNLGYTLEQRIAWASDLGLSLSVRAMERWKVALETPGSYSVRRIVQDSSEVHQRLRDEAEEKLFLYVSRERAPYYSDWRNGWELVITQFPSITIDIEEACKCLALERYTGSVFHLMRIMEAGLRSLAASLNDPSLDPRRNPSWESILKKCDDELKKPLAQRAPEWTANEPFFSGAAVRLRGVKDSWRNPTMHVEAVYPEAIAVDIFNHCASFMRHVASHLRETS